MSVPRPSSRLNKPKEADKIKADEQMARDDLDFKV